MSKRQTNAKSKKKVGAPKKAGLLRTFVPKRSPDVLGRQNPDGTIAVLHFHNSECFYRIHGIAAEAWNLVDGHSSLEVIGRKILRKFPIPEPFLEQKLSRFFTQLIHEQLIET